MIAVHVNEDAKLLPRKLCELDKKTSGPEKGLMALDIFWQILERSNILGFGYYSTNSVSGLRKWRAGRYADGDMVETQKNHDGILESLLAKNALNSIVLELPQRKTKFIVCPVYGPYNQNGVFVMEGLSQDIAVHSETTNELNVVAQHVHVIVANSDALEREKKFSLSKRETQVLRVMCKGLSNRAIADELGISVYTINAYVRQIMLKLGVNDRVSVCMIGLTVPTIFQGSNGKPTSGHIMPVVLGDDRSNLNAA